MVKINFWKDILKILTGFLTAVTLGCVYFVISGWFPPKTPGVPQLTPELSYIVIVFGLIIVGILIYLIFLRRGSEKINFKDISKILVGVSVYGLFGSFKLVSLKMIDYPIIGVFLILVCIFIYLGFFRK